MDPQPPLAEHEPLAGNPKFALYVLALVVGWFGARGAGLVGGRGLNSADFVFLVLTVTLPTVMAFRFGVRALLFADRVTVLRFGRERKSFPLTTFEGVQIRYGYRVLAFRNGVVAVESQGAEDFIRAVKQAARQHGVAVAPAVSQIAPNEAFFDLGHLKLDPDLCVACDSPAVTQAKFKAVRGFDMIVSKHVVYVRFVMPLCSECHRRRRNWRWGMRGGYLVALLPIVFGPGVFDLISVGTLVAVSLPMLTLVAVFDLNLARGVAEWHGAGVRVGPLNPEHSGATLRFKNPNCLARALRSSQGTDRSH